MSDNWYKTAIVYAIDVGTFKDADGDGVGDFPGLTSRLDYLAGLGVTCLWLLPFYPSSNKDNGYDIIDYLSVEARHGTLADFVEFMDEANRRGIRVLVDLVVNHSSDQHPWFQSARSDPESRYRDYYIWAEHPPEDTSEENVFPDQESGVWTLDETAQRYYYHKFYHFEPDLNNGHPAVRNEVRKIMNFWLQLGCAGFRVDAAPHIISTRNASSNVLGDPHLLLRELHDFLASRRADGVLMAETDVAPDELATFFGNGDEMQMLFNFLLDNYLFLAFAREEAEPIARALRTLPDKPAAGQWANFLRNLDELDLERLTQLEREDVFAAFAPKEDMRIYGRGIRRRLAPMLKGDRRRLQLAYSLLFSLPGTPVLVYGDEIGMGEDLTLPERNSVRTPMQWSPELNGGFSTAPPESMVRPVVRKGPFGYEKINVVDQRRDPESLFNWMVRVIALRRDLPILGTGDWEVIETNQRAVLAHTCKQDGVERVLIVHNLSRKACEAVLDRDEHKGERLVELFNDQPYELPTKWPLSVRVGPYGYRWLQILKE